MSLEYLAFPRIRGGDPRGWSGNTSDIILFPAYAGVILLTNSLGFPFDSFPRTCGGDPDAVFKAEVTNNFSPHTRG